jgi:hypothetical protein
LSTSISSKNAKPAPCKKKIHHREEGEEREERGRKIKNLTTEITEEEGMNDIFLSSSVISVFSVVKKSSSLSFFLFLLPPLCGKSSKSS